MTEIRLPMPPSNNHLYPSGKNGRRFASSEYKAWQKEAGWELKVQKIKPVEGPVIIHIDLDDTKADRSDADNRTKAPIDLLVAHKIIPNDTGKYVRRVSIGWEQITGCRVRIERVG